MQQLELQRCEQVETREAIERMHLEQQERQQANLDRLESEERARSEAEAQHAAEERRRIERSAESEQQRSVRAAPRSPELGATPLEASRLCVRQGGAIREAQVGDGVGYICELDGFPLFGAHRYTQSETLDQVKTRFEGGDLATVRANFESRLGPAEDVTINGGVRVWHWRRPDRNIELTTYDEGVSVTVSSVEEVLPAVHSAHRAGAMTIQ